MDARSQRGMHWLLKQMVANVLGDIGSTIWYKQSIKVTHVVQFNQEVNSYSCKVCCVSKHSVVETLGGNYTRRTGRTGQEQSSCYMLELLMSRFLIILIISFMFM